MAHLEKHGTTLIIHTKPGYKARHANFYMVSKNVYQSHNPFGSKVTASDGLATYSFGRIKTIIVVPDR